MSTEAAYPDITKDPIIPLSRALRDLAEIWSLAKECFALAPDLEAIIQAGTVYVDKAMNCDVMAIPTLHFVNSGSFDLGVAAIANPAFAVAALRFQALALPPSDRCALGIVLNEADGPFLSSILHFSRSGHLRLVYGTLGSQVIRFLRDGPPDLSGIRTVFHSMPEAHDLLAAESEIASDLAHFSPRSKKPKF